MSDTSLAEADAHVGRVLAGRYRVLELLGSGGMGSVYRAEHVHMKKLVAVKVLHRHMTTNAEVVARFEREAVAAGRIEHPNVAAATDFGKLEDGSFYLALEYVEGASLGEVIAQGPLAPARALRIARQIADGLAAAHAAGIVHRDLKPDNVLLVARESAPESVKVLDFGIAKLHLDEGGDKQPLTRIGTIFGTPQYMSPEQGQGKTVDARSDLYALGVMLYEMLAGKLPFVADDLVVLITRHVLEPPPALPESIPAGVRALTFALLEKNPDARVQSAAELVERIDALLAGEKAWVAPTASTEPAPPRGGTAPAPAQLFSAVRRKTGELGRRFAPALLRLSRAAGARFPLLARPVRFGRLTLPLGAVLAGGATSALLGALLALWLAPARGTRSHALASAAPAAGASPSDDERRRALRERARAGDTSALAALDALPQRQRALEDTLALAKGRCARAEWPACVAAYKTAALTSVAERDDPVLLADVRRAALDPVAYEDALRLAAHQLGEKGLDLLWDVWTSSRQKPELTNLNRRVRQFLDDGAVREHASRELGLVLELERVEKRKRCSEAKPLVAKASEYGDDRLVPILERFKSTRGCGFVGLGDCWDCLRGSDKALARALDVASTRRGPRFLGE